MVSEGTLALGIFLFLATNHPIEFFVIFFVLIFCNKRIFCQFLEKSDSTALNKLSADIISSVKEAFTGVKYIKIMGLENFFSEKLRKASLKFADSNREQMSFLHHLVIC